MSSTATSSKETAQALSFIAVFFLIIAGIVQFFQGMAAAASDAIFVTQQGYIFALSTTTWGWIHMILGILIIAAAVGVIGSKLWARWLAVSLLGLSIIANFLWLPHYPLWSIIVIGFSGVAVWAIARTDLAGNPGSKL